MRYKAPMAQVNPPSCVAATGYHPPAGYPIVVEVCEEVVCFGLSAALDQPLVEIVAGCKGFDYRGGVDKGLDPEVCGVVDVEVEGHYQSGPYHDRSEAGYHQDCVALGVVVDRSVAEVLEVGVGRPRVYVGAGEPKPKAVAVRHAIRDLYFALHVVVVVLVELHRVEKGHVVGQPQGHC